MLRLIGVNFSLHSSLMEHKCLAQSNREIVKALRVEAKALDPEQYLISFLQMLMKHMA